MVREKKSTNNRSSGFNVSMPNKWIDTIDAECSKKNTTRSKWMRDAAAEKLPALKKLKVDDEENDNSLSNND